MNTIFFWDYVGGVTVNYHSGGAVVIIDVDLEHARERWRKYVGEPSDDDTGYENPLDPKALDELPDRSFKIDAPPIVLVYGDSGCC